MITKDDVIKYINENPKDVIDICEKTNLCLNASSKEKLDLIHQILKERVNRLRERYSKKEIEFEEFQKACIIFKDFEDRYHMFEPEYDEKREKLYTPDIDDNLAHAVYKFRKGIYYTQRIKEDYELTELIHSDMDKIWEEKGGQDGMYDSFPFSKSYLSETDSQDYVDYMNNNIHSVTEVLRCYALNASGGIAIIETRTRETVAETGKTFTYKRYHILTLGEDDGYHFLNGARIYEDIYDGSSEDLLSLLQMCIDEYKKNI